ncbi:hypothetical protein BRYFOR_08396 [Marvinbryantia formatexigens DSM 14469]|uniref:Uncharacterized protein n=1 Tax=Marvinbryantia formatexigens DSM 14469 TaxID=478749 RepID=C6LIG1_9FIRM|nr:hypothetical protein BRYFOR_08396 [Marvinbryantia formatexigens DSM 14469]
MSQHLPAVSGGQKAVADKTGQFLLDVRLRQMAEVQIDIRHDISFVRYGAGGGHHVFDIAADGTMGQIFIIHLLRFQKEAEVMVGGEPPAGGELTADFHIIRTGICQNGPENLTELAAGVMAVHDIGGHRMGDNPREVFQNKAEGIVERNLARSDQQTVKRPVKFPYIDAETGTGNPVSGIIEISDPMESIRVGGVLLQRQNQIGGVLRGAEYRGGKLSERTVSGGDDGEIHADDYAGIGYDGAGEVQQILDGTVHHPGFKKRLVPFLIFAENLRHCLRQRFRVCARNQTEIRGFLKERGIGGLCYNQQAVQGILQKIREDFRRNPDQIAGKGRVRSVADAVFQTRRGGETGGSVCLGVRFL